jgi:hypothetical protein
MAEHDFTQRALINGCEPVTASEIEATACITGEQADAMGAIFRTIARLTEDREIRQLCAHGALQADMQSNDLDVIRERATKAGVFMKGAPGG